MSAVTGVSAAQNLLPRDELLRLENCGRESIRTLGSIQSYGVLLALDLATSTITHASKNAGRMLGVDAAALLGQSLEVALGAAAAARIIETAGEQHRPGQPADDLAVPVNDQFLDIVQHRVCTQLLVELEPAEPVAHATLLDQMNRLTAGLALARTVPELMGEATRALRDLTQFDRVLAYAFHPDGHGEVLAEEHADGMDDYLGLHFPASDVPAQARRLYVANPLRAMVDSGSDPVPVLAGPGRETPALDLGPAALRAVSSHHLTFMRNMGQAATLTLSLTRRDTLIGMITCSHRVPHRLPYAVRRALRSLAQQMSLQVAAIQENVRLKRQLESHSTRTALAAQLRSAPHPVDGLTEGPVSLLDMLPADGAVAFFGGEFRRVGAAPVIEQSHAVARHLRRRRPEEVFASATLTVDDPELAGLVPDVAGLVFVPLGAGDDYLI